MEQQGIYERIKDRVGQLKGESKDRFFTEYLMQLDSSLIQEKHRLDMMETQLDQNCQIYRQRMAAADRAVKSETLRAVPAADKQEMNQAVPAGDTQEVNQAVPAADTQGMNQILPPIDTRNIAQAVVSPVTAERAVQPGVNPSQDTYSGSNVSRQAAFSQTYMHPQTPTQSRADFQTKKNREFAIGINVFGTIGVLFVLAALILLGINYMGSLVKELGLYVLGLLVWCVAEFVVKKKSQILSMFFSSLGIGSLYVTTMVNFLYLHNFSGLVTILITTFITVVVMFVSRKKDAGILRIICIGACMVSFLMMDIRHMISDVELLIYMVMIVAVQLLGIFLPVKKWAYGIAIGQMAGAAVFAWIFAIFAVPSAQVMELRSLYVIGFVVVSILLMELTVWRMPAENREQMQGICVTFGIGAFLSVLAYYQCSDGLFSWHHGTYEDVEIWIRLVVVAAIADMGVLFFFLTKNKGYLRWMQGYFVAGSALLLFGHGDNERLSVTITLTILMILYKLLAYRKKPLWVADAIITTWTALAALVYYDNLNRSVYGYVLLGVLLLGILLMNHWQTYYEFLLTGTVILYIAMAVDNELMLSLMIAVMWLATLLFNCVKRFAGKGIQGYNVTMLVMEVSGFLGLAFFQKYDNVVIYLILTVLGLGIILFTFQPGFLHGAEGWRGLTIAGFLTYMVLVTRFEYRITSSILMMVVGLLGIIFGFHQTDRKLRIYGLVLCMITCFKITLFDFRVQSLQRIILFLAAGGMALVISGIYALMDKKYSKESDDVQSNSAGSVGVIQEKDKMEM